MNLEDLTKELTTLYAEIRAGKIELPVAHELNNTAVNIQGVVRLGLLNAKLQNKVPNLDFFKEAHGKATKQEPQNG